MKYEDIECYGDDKKYESNHICVGKYGGYTYLYPCSLNAAQVEFSHFEDKYSKFCYTNLFGFNVSKGMGCLKEIAIDSSMAVSYDNQFFIGRNHAALKKIGGGVIQSQWKVNPYLNIASYICMFGKWHTRIHMIDTEKDISCQGVSYELSVEGSRVLNHELRGIDALKRMYTFIRRFAG
ncbi:DUF2264 C-terminal domain-containing protein [Sporofaciens musculi]|uniref:DUF2264 C-terminal domain-containing protein n=1 Tax=Sporofaciens musculi TaxID=2681861 RepID=UPI00258E7E24|nr:hypothetical protein [Sporofaciens musculi]